MKTSAPSGQPASHLQTRHGKWRQRKGVALILVVSFIVLMSALVVGFFSRVTTDLSGARSYAEGISARQLAESAVSIVMGQIRAATTIPNGCWASQPGMIRVYGGQNGQAGPLPYRFYKLYSSHNLVLESQELSNFKPSSTGFTNPGSGANAEVPIGSGGWQFQPAFFTDLNEGAEIIDVDPDTGQTKTNAGTGKPQISKRYPIFDPSVARIPAIGQNVGAISGIWTKGSVEGCEVNITDQATLQLNKAPMPVRWIYVLRDGTLTVPTPLTGPAPAGSSAGLKAVWSTVGNANANPSTGIPSKDNPIVGRIAFWTDDDTCKVNINTAGGFITDDSVTPDYRQSQMYRYVYNPDGSFRSTGPSAETNPAFVCGSFWDTPRVQTFFDRGISAAPADYRPGLACSQPVRNEFQRYPGHPSTTSLALVMSGLLPVNTPLTSELLYKMTPRIMSGDLLPNEVLLSGSLAKNSKGGTRALITYEQHLDNDLYGLTPDPPSTIKKAYDPKVTYVASKADTWSYHLLSNLDELYYSTLNDPTVKAKNNERTPTDKELGLTAGTITPATIDKARFFLTAHSRSPELNLLGRPRVCIWPIPSKQSQLPLLNTTDATTGKRGIRNPSDDLFQFCATVGADPNAQNDPNGTIRTGQFIFDREDSYASSGAGSDIARTRNAQIFRYLQDVTSNSKGKIPGWGGSFQNKYSAFAGRDQILIEIFDYIRTVNLKDTSRDEKIDLAFGRNIKKRDSEGNPPAAVPDAEKLKASARYSRRGLVVPTKTTINGTQVSGFGRFPTISEVSLVLYHGGYIYKPRKGTSIQEDVEYDFAMLDERRYNSNGATKTWFDNNMITEQLVRAFVIVETFNPMQGYGPVTRLDYGAGRERLVYEITSLDGFRITNAKGVPEALGIGLGKNETYLVSGDTWAGRNFGGTEGFFHTMQGKTGVAPYANPANPPFPWGTGSNRYLAYGGPAGGGRPNKPDFALSGSTGYYPFQSLCQDKFSGVRIPYGGDGYKQSDPLTNTPPDRPPRQKITFKGGTIKMDLRYKDVAHQNLPQHDELVQQFEFKFEDGEDWPAPITEKDAEVAGEGYRQDRGGFDKRVANFGSDDTDALFGTQQTWGNNGGLRMPYYLPLRINWAQQHSNDPWTKFDKNQVQVGNGKSYAGRFLQILQPGDVIRSVIPGGTISESSDTRTVALQKVVTNFKIHPNYKDKIDNTNEKRSAAFRAQTLRCADGQFYFNPTSSVWFGNQATQATTGSLAQIPSGARYLASAAPDIAKGVTAKLKDGANTLWGDFDTGIGSFPDGAYCGKADEGNLSRSWKDEWKVWHFIEPYFSTWTYDPPGDTYFSPNRQIPSPVMFGSLLAPRVTISQAGWKTLLFCPNPAAGPQHHGFSTPPDHLLLDLFNMPVIEPYAISEPFSTDGKVNLNYELMPFNYIERSTALRAALQPLRVTAIPTNFTFNRPDLGGTAELAYKGFYDPSVNRVRTNPENFRYLVDREETLKGFKNVFAQDFGRGFFKSASQICEMFLYPKGQPVVARNSLGSLITYTPGDTGIKTWWANNCSITGDNVREKPYSDLYSRVTTKSNTYTVHYRVQSLRQQPYTGSTTNTAAINAYYQTWDESRDKVLSEYRGHTTIERYLDPRDPRFTFTNTNPALPLINPETQSLEPAYRFRVIYNKRFAPW